KRCAEFLRGLHPNVTAGGMPALALMFDMNRPFESYVTWRARRAFKGLQLQPQGPRRFLAANQPGKGGLEVGPDLSVLRGTQGALIADAKWKILSPEERKWGIASADLYQLVSYALRYQCQRLALMYPAMEGLNPGLREKLTIEGSDVQLAICSINLAGVLVSGDAVFDELRSWVVEG